MSKRFGLIGLAVLLAALAVPVNSSAQGTVEPVQCAVMSWSPEMFSFYGDKDTVLAKFQALDRDLLKHRVYAFIVESNRGSRLTFFELEPNGRSMDMASMAGASFSELSNQITTTLLTNNGDKCAGMAAKDLVTAFANGKMAHTAVARPASAGDAFQYALSQAEGEYIRATFILLC